MRLYGKEQKEDKKFDGKEQEENIRIDGKGRKEDEILMGLNKIRM